MAKRTRRRTRRGGARVVDCTCGLMSTINSRSTCGKCRSWRKYVYILIKGVYLYGVSHKAQS
ncbi:unnamed protein product [Penicillium roqueforti FM164]|uniref:Genomic scaffold, ProqFM164S04 n=1 Tax=Penicillium roqueforti (strain FM164) TaxID=1365484 RepID=W6QIP5_PENRF|nr:unnamed protein product [Penicillium roqueforti FM164]